MKAIASALCGLVLASVGCSAPEGPSEAPEAAALASAPAPALWLQPGEIGHDEQALWGMPLPEGFDVEVLEHDAFFQLCDALAPEPCASTVSGWAQLPARVVVRADLTPAGLRATLLHEMGHVLRGDAGHLPCSRGEHVMCERSPAAIPPLLPTGADFDFVLRGDGVEL